MGKALKIQHVGNVDVGFVEQSQVGNIGVVGGANGLGAVSGGNTILCIANIQYAAGLYAAGNAYIVTQKGKHTFLVANTANSSRSQICILSNVADANVANLTAGQMAIQARNAASANIALYGIMNSHAVGFPPDYANANSQGNLANATSYHVSFVAANATPQPGSGLTILRVTNS